MQLLEWQNKWYGVADIKFSTHFTLTKVFDVDFTPKYSVNYV